MILQSNPQASRRGIAANLQVNPSAVQKHLEKLKELGVIERVGGTRGYWQVKI